MRTKTHTQHKHHNGHGRYHDTTQKLIDISESTLSRLDEAVESLQDQTQKYSKSMGRYVIDNPQKSVGISFLAGMGFAILLRGILKR